MRRFFSALVLLLAVYFGLSQFAELQQVGEILRKGNIFWLGLAVAVQFAWLVNQALMYRSIYDLLDMPANLAHLLPLVVTSNFVNVVAPTGGISGMAVFVSDAHRMNRPASRVTIAGVLYILFDYFGFICVLMLGLAVLFRRNSLDAVEIGASAVLIATALILAGLLILGVYSAQALERVLIGAARAINRLLYPLLHRNYLSEALAHTFAAGAAEGLHVLRASWRGYALPAAYALSGKALMIAILFLTFLAFGQPFSVGTLIAGFSLAYLFTIVSPTPMGLGVVEGVLASFLTSSRIPLEAATIITLAYRGLTFWLPFIYGFIAFRVMQRRWHMASP